MTKVEDATRNLRLDRDAKAQQFFEHGVYNHWDPYHDIAQETIERDRQTLVDYDITEEEFEELMLALALFGAGEEAVTEDVAPLLLALDDVDKQMFVASQIYDEAKHTQFFDRIWREIIVPAAEAHGFDVTYPTNQRFFNDEYVELFDRTETAMERLLTDDTPENRVKAYCHYHLVVESVLAQTGYYGLQSALSDRGDDIAVGDFPNSESVVTGIGYIRADEGRHVGFGMHEIRTHVHDDGVDEQVVHDTLMDLMPLVANTLSRFGAAVDPVALVDYSRTRFTRRMEVLTDAEAEIPDIETLVDLDTQDSMAAD
ncbi:ribonucleoside-diphosphate reductase [Halomarina salina]|uniref:Ribonucleoside-diphosphate reductase n=1 Tax=Halomarina salina TaxID=1872699 RepID=A0ABD5RN08_9EURY|nr:ribonucleoside-diphosphate reductase [Halomarina salina]